MRSRHQVLQDSISHVRPLLKKARHGEVRSAAISSCRGVIVWLWQLQVELAVRVLRRARALRRARTGCPLTAPDSTAVVHATDVES